MPPVGFEPTISAGERPQTYALDRAAFPIISSNLRLRLLCRLISSGFLQKFCVYCLSLPCVLHVPCSRHLTH